MSKPERKRPVAKVYHLAVSIQAWGETVTDVEISRPTARDLISAGDRSAADYDVKILEKLTLIPASSLMDLDGYDLTKLTEIVVGFLSTGPGTGKSP